MKFQRDRFTQFIEGLADFLDSKEKPIDFAIRNNYNLEEWKKFDAKYDLSNIRCRHREYYKGQNNEI